VQNCDRENRSRMDDNQIFENIKTFFVLSTQSCWNVTVSDGDGRLHYDRNIFVVAGCVEGCARWTCGGQSKLGLSNAAPRIRGLQSDGGECSVGLQILIFLNRFINSIFVQTLGTSWYFFWSNFASHRQKNEK
jgi:hypothetical protein